MVGAVGVSTMAAPSGTARSPKRAPARFADAHVAQRFPRRERSLAAERSASDGIPIPTMWAHGTAPHPRSIKGHCDRLFMQRIATIIRLGHRARGDFPCRRPGSAERIATGTGADRHVAIRSPGRAAFECEANAVLDLYDDHLALVDETFPSELAEDDLPGAERPGSTTFADGTACGRLVGDGFESELSQELAGPDALPDLIVRPAGVGPPPTTPSPSEQGRGRAIRTAHPGHRGRSARPSTTSSPATAIARFALPKRARSTSRPRRTFTSARCGDPTKEIYDESFSVLRLTDPYSFTDPRQYYYAPYVTSRASMADAFGTTLDYLETRHLFERLPERWAGALPDRRPAAAAL